MNNKLNKEAAMSNKKYSLIKTNKKSWVGEALFQVKAKISFGSVSKGELGGYIAKESNLSDEGDAWVSGDAEVSGNAWVSGNAEVYGDARVSGDAWVYGDAEVSGDAEVYGNAEVYGDAWVFGNAWVYGNAWVSGNARVSGNAINTGYCFAYKNNDWDITEVPTKDGSGVLLIKDYKTPEKSDTETIDIGGKTYEVTDELKDALKKLREV